MRFGSVSIEDAAGATLAHSINVADKRLSKGTVLDRENLRKLADAGFEEVIVARADEGDLTEDAAAARIAAAFQGPDIFSGEATTGRVNLHAERAGLVSINAGIINAFNAVDPAITIATLPDNAPVRAGQMVATVKIIPFFVSETMVDKALSWATNGARAIRLTAFRSMRAGLVQTRVPDIAEKMLDKTAAVAAARLARAGSHIAREMRVPHETDALSQALRRLEAEHDVLIVFGASAVADTDDIIPAALERAGGRVERVGMPVDPGNLLVLGTLAGKPVIGAPGCARSPKENGFDWVLDRVLAGHSPSSDDIAAMGVGGLLQEIETRPRPRETGPRHVPVSAIILAAGGSRRMGDRNKLLALFDGEPAVHRATRIAVESDAVETVLVCGYEAERIHDAVSGLDVTVVNNTDFAEGMASSLRSGLTAIEEGHGALILLGDMPHVETRHLNVLIEAFERRGGRAVIRGSCEGRAGNPVILPPGIVREAALLTGDTGARHLIEASGAPIDLVDIGEAALTDIDTPEALLAAGGKFAD
ncbi:NTP transferase domain-containing protein [Notoacmeibacter ruber]|uniref:4-diphosphocytidyl-2C-methyl-D-erythritol kinase n=1 Tax=Notoacmeibacter ruber TaxID=2670375 RepID=A0A3L7JBP8_9HYPH|nr:molybdopterin-binding/glycosyltransferase family 2 protein [Notoacmeibacter ruber]RLQ88056.1 4-diphosphocytidyl-2C-methyl-D-erythritol kinase [Notoacmeibacter ruber]